MHSFTAIWWYSMHIDYVHSIAMRFEHPKITEKPTMTTLTRKKVVWRWEKFGRDVSHPFLSTVTRNETEKTPMDRHTHTHTNYQFMRLHWLSSAGRSMKMKRKFSFFLSVVLFLSCFLHSFCRKLPWRRRDEEEIRWNGMEWEFVCTVSPSN